MINFKVEVYNSKEDTYVDYTPFAVFPPKVANLLDEQLDEMSLTLKNMFVKNMSVEYFQPFTEFKITILNKPECLLTAEQISQIKAKKEIGVYYIPDDESIGKLTETYSITMVVANDRAIEVPVGSKRYNHEVYLIEQTKILERFISDSLTFSNPLGNVFSEKAGALCSYKSYSTYADSEPVEGSFFSTLIKEGYLIDSNPIYIPDPDQLEEDETKPNGWSSFFLYGYKGATSFELKNLDTNTIITPTSNNKYNLNKGNYQIKYSFPSSNADGSVVNTRELFYTFTVFTDYSQLKKWTITSVINRVLDLIEPLEYPYDTGGTGDLPNPQPRFYLNEDQAEKYDKIIAPEFSFTRATLREILQQIGGFGAVHAEPRISKRAGDRYEIIFDEYGSNEYSNISKEAYVNATFGTDINQYCTALDSSADNLTNTLDWAQGVVVEPTSKDTKSLRTEQTTARLAEDNSTFISTQLPIQTLNKLEWYDGEKYYDITAYVFESTDYSTTLSSFKGAYPFSKAYALYYTYGQKNIQGLFFKAEHAISPIFHNYSIINVLRAVTGKSNLDYTGNALMKLRFRVTYKPKYSARVRTHKQIILDGTPSMLAYNQGANAIESNYYGTHLRAVVERLGTVEKTYTYQLAFLSQIPKVGRKFDDNYYISNVTYEILPFSIKCTIALSKHFNRLSTYVGINSQKRMWEISERQTQQRQSIFTSYIVASLNKPDPPDPPDANTVSVHLATPVSLLLNGEANSNAKFLNPVSWAFIKPKDYNNDAITNKPIALPVVSSVFGNAMTFTFSFEDNYSAGQKLIEVEGDKTTLDNVTGMWGDYVPYTDYYGRMYYIEYMLMGSVISDADIGSNQLPQYDNNTPPNTNRLLGARCLYRKDNREVPQITHEIAVVTDNSYIVIGPALCSNCSAVNAKPKEFKLYLLENKLNILDGKLDLENATQVDISAISFTENSIQLNSKETGPIDTEFYKSWALVTEITPTEITVANEAGQSETQEIQEGGELLIGRNFSTAEEAIEPIYLTYKRNIN